MAGFLSLSPAARRRFRWGVRAAAVALLAFVGLPYAVAPFYRWIDPVSTLMAWRKLTGQRVERIWTPLDRMSPAVPLAVIAAEDAKFCRHHGIDFGELREAIAEADDIGDMRGGSTLTQQLAKNLFLWQGRSFVRKGLEFPLALWLDLVLPKRRQMELYLNIAEWGPNGQFGAEAGARFAFAKGAREVQAREAALLASVLPNPRRRSARQPGPGVRRLAGIYQARMARTAGLDRCLRRDQAL